MKKTIYGILIITLVLMVSSLFAQENKYYDNVRVDIHVVIDQKPINDSITLTIINHSTTSNVTLTVDSKFILFLDYDMDYDIYVTKANCNTKIVHINTCAPHIDWHIITGINLTYDNTDTVVSGGIKYDKLLQTFKKYKL